jgi:hypothetical protein
MGVSAAFGPSFSAGERLGPSKPVSFGNADIRRTIVPGPSHVAQCNDDRRPGQECG